MTQEAEEQELRERALKRIRKKRDFSAHLLAYVAVNGLLIAIWAVTSGGFFWPIFPLLGWGIGLLFHGWDVYQGEPTEAEISKEIERMRRST